jgi:hypothetical protein
MVYIRCAVQRVYLSVSAHMSFNCFNSLPYLYYGSDLFGICRSKITSIEIACTFEL